MAALLLLIGGLTIMSIILGARCLDALAWRRSLVAYKLRLPRGLTTDDIAAWLNVVTAHRAANHLTVLSWPAAILEIVATREEIAHYLLVTTAQRTQLLAALRATLPSVRLEEASDYIADAPTLTAACELRVTSTRRLLADDRAQTASTALLASLHPLGAGEKLHLQFILAKARTPHPSRVAQDDSDFSWLLNASTADRDLLRAERLKHREPLLKLSARFGVSAASSGRARALLHRVVGMSRILDASGISIVRRAVPSSFASRRLMTRAVPLTTWPLIINTKESVGLLGLPVGDVHLPGLTLGSARQLPASQQLPTSGTVVGVSNYPGMVGRPLALRPNDRLRHTWCIGPTGTGKSTLLAQLILQDIAAGSPVIVIDPKADLVADVLARVPGSRRDDVIVLDPAASTPIGFNILQAGKSEHARELVVDHIVHVFAELWRSSWGPRTSDVLRSSLLTLTHTKAADGTAFTLADIPELLTNPEFRHLVTIQSTVPPSVRQFWRTYEQLSDGERAQTIGPAMNKLRSLTTRTALRLMLGQSQGINLADIFRKRQILLVPLNKGVIGTETAHLLGSLLVAGLWQTTLSRATIPAAKRFPVWMYLDEFQDTLRLSENLADMLAQARGLGLGLTLAHQYLDQLSGTVKSAILGTVRTHIAFQVEHDDAKALEKRFAPALSADDLRGLDAYEIAMRPCVGGATISPVTGTTLPLGEPLQDADELAQQSSTRYGVSRAEVEAALLARVAVNSSQPLGRRQHRGGSS